MNYIWNSKFITQCPSDCEYLAGAIAWIAWIFTSHTAARIHLHLQSGNPWSLVPEVAEFSLMFGEMARPSQHFFICSSFLHSAACFEGLFRAGHQNYGFKFESRASSPTILPQWESAFAHTMLHKSRSQCSSLLPWPTLEGKWS